MLSSIPSSGGGGGGGRHETGTQERMQPLTVTAHAFLCRLIKRACRDWLSAIEESPDEEMDCMAVKFLSLTYLNFGMFEEFSLQFRKIYDRWPERDELKP